MGVDPATAVEQGAADEEAIREAVAAGVSDFAAQLGSGVPIQGAAVSAGGTLAWQLATILLGGAGTIVSTLLAKWLGTEKKITTSLIRGVEKGKGGSVKETIKAEATSAGVEAELHTRVASLTPV